VRQYRFETGRASIRGLTGHLITDGSAVEVRDQWTIELTDVAIEIQKPQFPQMDHIGRGWNKRIAIAEFLQLTGGFSEPAVMTAVAPSFERFLDDGRFWAAYGERTKDQFQHVVRKLVDDPGSRQAVVTLWNPARDNIEGKHDYPCTLSLQFRIREERLELTTCMRSNDVWWGWSYDLFQFTQLQHTVANCIGVEVGHYVHFANSLHIYERDIDAALQLHEPDTFEPQEPLTGIGSDKEFGNRNWQTYADIAHEIFYDRSFEDCTASEEYYRSAGLHDVWAEIETDNDL
jgi:thymidylate synthase